MLISGRRYQLIRLGSVRGNVSWQVAVLSGSKGGGGSPPNFIKKGEKGYITSTGAGPWGRGGGVVSGDQEPPPTTFFSCWSSFFFFFFFFFGGGHISFFLCDNKNTIYLA